MAAASQDREKALDLALAQIDKNYGKGSVMRLGEEARQPIEIIPTGSVALDIALGIGGMNGAAGSHQRVADDRPSAQSACPPKRGRGLFMIHPADAVRRRHRKKTNHDRAVGGR